jgi:hypothetical protein
MPATGGAASSPERYGGGEGNSNAPLVQRIYESLGAQMGNAYDQAWPPSTPFAMETFAIAKAIAFDGYGCNQRLQNNFRPDKCTAVTGMLQRWERIFNVPPLPTDTEAVRRARVSAAWTRFTTSNSLQPIVDALAAALGPVFVQVNHQTTGNALSYVQGITAVTAVGTTPPAVTVAGSPINPSQIQIAVTTGGPRGTALFKWSTNNGGSYVQTGQTTVATFPLLLGAFDTGLVAKFPPGTYTNDNVYTMQADPTVPWLSTLAHIDVQVTQPSALYGAPNVPNALFYATVAQIGPILDQALPFWCTWSWYMNNSSGTIGFKFDEADYDVEAFGAL